MKIREINDHSSLSKIASHWSDLAGRQPGNLPFMLPQFLLPYLSRVGKRYRYRVLTAWDGEKLVGLAPLFERRVGKLGLRLTVFSFPASGTPPPFDLLIDPGCDGVLPAFIEALRQSDWGLIELQNVPAGSSSEKGLRKALAGLPPRFSVSKSRTGVYVPIVGSWEAYFRSLSKKRRQAYTRALRKCDDRGGVRIVRYPGGEVGLEQALEMMSKVIEASWKKPQDDDLDGKSHLHHLARGLDSGNILDLRFVLVGDKPVAYLFQIDYRRRFHAYHTAYDLDYQKEGPGVLLLGDALQSAHERGDERYDLLGEGAVHINRWSSQSTMYNTLRIVNAGHGTKWKAALYCRIRDRRVATAKSEAEKKKEAAKSAARRGA